MSEADRELPYLKKKPVEIRGGKGAELLGADGTAYLDMGASYGVALLGHDHPRIRRVRERADELPAAHFTYPHPARDRFYAALTEATGLDRVFPTSSGTEAIEAAVKTAVAATGRTGIVAVEGAFHGRSLGALAQTWRRPARDPFEELLHEVTFVEPEPGAVDAVDEETALFLAEPIQGEGGVRPLPDAFLQAARERCRDVGAAFGLDEVQTGLGRTGDMLAGGDLDPDVVCLGKGLGNGFPVAACVAAEELADVPRKAHGGTFNGSPRAAATGTAVLETVRDDDLPDRAARLGERLLDGLEAIDAETVRRVRGEGLMAAVQLREHNGPVLRELAGQGVLALSAGRTVVRFLPPLIVTEEQVDRTVDAMEAVLDA